MSSSITSLARDLYKTITESDKRKVKPYDSDATVVKVEDNVVWVKIPGGVDVTPVKKTIDAKEGDTVKIRVSDHRAWITGNNTAPPTDDTRAREADINAKSAYRIASEAFEAANNAEQDAIRAHEAADRAEAEAERAYGEAERATGYANDALTQLGVVEEVVDVLSWISEHGTYKKSTDTTVVEHRMYFTLTGTVVVPETYDDGTKKITNLESYYEKVNNVYVKTSDTTYNPSKTYYTVSAELVDNPTGSPSANNYYEIFSIDQAVQNYISSHLALTDSGLWVVKDNQGYKALLANDGLRIYDNSGHLVSIFGESIVFDSSRPQSIGGENAYILFHDTNDDDVPDTITIGGNVIMNGSNETLSEMLTDIKATADGALTYDHTYVIETDENTGEKIATFTAHVYRGGQDVTSEFSDEQFTWYYKTDALDDRLPINNNLSNNPQNCGKTMTISIVNMKYGGEVIGYFTTGSTQRLLRSNGDTLTDVNNRNLLATTQASGEEIRVRDLAYTTSLYPTDGVLIVQSEDERLTTIASLADAIWDKYGVTIEQEPLLQGDNDYEDIGLNRLTNSELDRLFA